MNKNELHENMRLAIAPYTTLMKVAENWPDDLPPVRDFDFDDLPEIEGEGFRITCVRGVNLAQTFEVVHVKYRVRDIVLTELPIHADPERFYDVIRQALEVK